MNVITLASRKGGVGKSTLTAHLAAYAHLMGRRCMVVDADPQGSLTLWHSMRADNRLVLQNAALGINRLVASALLAGYEWVFIDTAPTTWLVVQEAIRAATMVIPVRPGFFDLAAVCETVATAREFNKPYAVVINAAPVKREGLRRSPCRGPSSNGFPSRYGRAKSANARHSLAHSPQARVQARFMVIPLAKWRLPGCGPRSSARSKPINRAQADAAHMEGKAA